MIKIEKREKQTIPISRDFTNVIKDIRAEYQNSRIETG
jgi:hypothetical protein